MLLSGADAILSCQTLQRLWKGYGEIVRITLQGGSWPSVVVKDILLSPFQASQGLSHQRKVRSYQVEMAWYKHWSQFCPPTCRVPQCYAQGQIGHHKWLILEDLGLTGFAPSKRRLTNQEIDGVLSWLAHFHAHHLGKCADELWPIGTYWHLATRREEWNALPESPLKQAAITIDQRLNDCRFFTLVHGDAKQANFCFGAVGVAAVDFQYIGRGCGIKDLVYFLQSVLVEAEYGGQVDSYLEHYFSYLRRAVSPSVQVDDLETEWRSLFPLAWTDLYRFELGWMGPEAYSTYSEKRTQETLRIIGHGC